MFLQKIKRIISKNIFIIVEKTTIEFYNLFLFDRCKLNCIHEIYNTEKKLYINTERKLSS